MSFNLNIKGFMPQDVRKSDESEASPTIQTISPSRLHGLCMWLDGQCNTVNGVDRSKKYMEDLVYNSPKTVSSIPYYSTPALNTWDGDFLNFGTFARYPYCGYPQMTMEFVIKLSKVPTSTIQISHLAYNGGYSCCINTDQKFVLSARLGNEYIYVSSKSLLDINKPYYLVATLNDNKEIAVEIKNISERTAIPFAKISMSTLSDVYMGVGTLANKSIEAIGEYWDGLNLGMMRIWRRVLSEDEIEANYQDIKKRFNF